MKIFFFSLITVMILSSCGNPTGTVLSNQSVSVSSTPLPAGGGEPAVRVIFNVQNFTTLDTFNPMLTGGIVATEFQCTGDLVTDYYVTAGDYSITANQAAFPLQPITDALSPSTHPGFLKNVSVDMTNTYYVNSPVGEFQSDPCSYRGVSTVALPNGCSDFNRAPAGTPTPTPGGPTPTPTPTPTPAFTSPTPTPVDPYPTPGTTGPEYYRVLDDWCAEEGPIIDPDTELTKAHIGGVSIDLDRTQLNAGEDLMMNITYHSFNGCPSGIDCESDVWPLTVAGGTTLAGPNDQTVLSVELLSTGLALSALLTELQPRAWADYDSSSIPVYMQTLASLQDPYGSLRTEQVYVPLSQFPSADRIRIERVRGNYFMYQVDLYRLGSRNTLAQ